MILTLETGSFEIQTIGAIVFCSRFYRAGSGAYKHRKCIYFPRDKLGLNRLVRTILRTTTKQLSSKSKWTCGKRFFRRGLAGIPSRCWNSELNCESLCKGAYVRKGTAKNIYRQTIVAITEKKLVKNCE